MKVAAIIPARLASSRLPRKLLLADTGRPLIQHTYEAVRGCTSIDLVAVATGDHEIKAVVEGFGGKVLLTDPDCPTGTERIRWATKQLPANFDYIINVQGDEPEIDQASLMALLACGHAGIATLAAPLIDHTDFERPNVVKVVCDQNNYALYFSRAAIPYNASGQDFHVLGLRHIGVYGFQRVILDKLPTGGTLERWEKLEQLSWLEAGQRILVAVVALSHAGIDTAVDYAAFVQRQRVKANT
jgi:3-deoxy-manno-octulosonate cytidylyltransferase (CMP-KDO synthetase)